LQYEAFISNEEEIEKTFLEIFKVHKNWLDELKKRIEKTSIISKELDNFQLTLVKRF